MEGNIICHIQLVHKDAKYDCNWCEYRDAIQGYLICHIKLVHEEAKYDCNWYEYRDTIQGNLACHIHSNTWRIFFILLELTSAGCLSFLSSWNDLLILIWKSVYSRL